MVFSEEESGVLSYFFTNLYNPIFCTKNFHPEVWALMQARYSRSREGLRESFLKLLKEDANNFDILKAEIAKIGNGMEMANATTKAIQFMEKWVLGYGHNSVAEGAVIGIGFEGVSILATKVIEDNRLCSFIEKSTRYVSFDDSSFYFDEDLKNSEFAEEIKKTIEFIFNVYKEMHDPVLNYIKRIVPLKAEMTEAAWERACAARRFDSIRYLLPAGTKTSLGWTVNARQLEHAIKKLLSHPIKEMRDIGLQLKLEGIKVLPSLLKYADKNDFFSETERDMQKIASAIKISDTSNYNKVQLVDSSENPTNKIIASILYRWKSEPYNQILEQVKQMSYAEKEHIFDSYMQKMGVFDHPLRELEHEDFTFDIVMDYGAFRDLQRHRICTQTNQIFNTDLGYDIPKDIIDAGQKSKYVEAMEKAKALYEKIKDRFPLQAQYILPLGFRKRYILTMNLRELHHLVKIRTTPQAHESYRKIVLKIYEIMKEKFPLISKYLKCGYCDEDLGRLRQEEKLEKMGSPVLGK
jgi:thymidylate synthase ThyX